MGEGLNNDSTDEQVNEVVDGGTSEHEQAKTTYEQAREVMAEIGSAYKNLIDEKLMDALIANDYDDYAIKKLAREAVTEGWNENTLPRVVKGPGNRDNIYTAVILHGEVPDTLEVSTIGEWGILELDKTDRLPTESDANDPNKFYVDIYHLPLSEGHMSFPDDEAVLRDVQAIRAQLETPLSTSPTE